MIRLKELHAYNFKSWEELHLTDLDKMGLTLIQGENGAGKSSVRQIIEYLLTDAISDGIPLEEIPRNKTEGCKVDGVFQRDNDTFTITKFRNHKKYKNSTFLTINDNDLSKTDRRETQKEIENVFNINKDVLQISTVFSQNSMSFCDATESERKSIIYKARNLNDYEIRYEKAKNKCKEIEDDILETEVYLKITIEKIEDNDKQIEQTKVLEDDWEAEEEDKKQQLQLQLDELKIEYTDDIEKEIDEQRLHIINTNSYSLSEFSISQSEIEDKVASVREELSINKRDLNSIKRKLREDNITCPVLGHECNILDEKRKEKIEKYERSITVHEISIGVFEKELDEWEEKLQTLIDIEDVNKQIEEDIKKLKHEMELINHSNNNIEDRRKELKKRIEQKKENPYTPIIIRLYTDIEDLVEKLDLIKQDLDKLRESLKYYDFWKKGYSKAGIPNLKAEEFIESIEIETNNILSDLSDNIYVELDSRSTVKTRKEQVEKISYLVHHPGSSVTNFKSFSGGERQRIRIADLLSFNKLLSQFSFIFLDEVLELSLDAKGKDAITSYLKLKAREIGSIFVVSHDEAVKGKFENFIKIEKENSISRIV